MKSKFLIICMFIFPFTLGLVACSNDQNTSSEDTDEQVLVFARGADSESLDFASTNDGEVSRVTRQVFESLLSFSEESFEVIPGLAHDWKAEDDGKVYTFYLEEGVKFHDGTDFNAEAVKTNFERWADPAHEYSFADDGYFHTIYGTMFGGFKGDEGHVIEEINVLGDHEVEFVLKEPLGYFLQNMAMDDFAIASPASFEEFGTELNQNPVGTGPFKFVSWSKDDSIILEKFEDYRKEGLPKLDKVIFKVIPDNSARLIALRSGEVDIIDGLNPDDAEGVDAEDNLELYTRSENNFGYLGFNTTKEPIDDKLVRQAINHSIDRQAIADALYAGYASSAVNPLPPGYLGYNDEIEGYEFSKEKAKDLLAEAGYKDGFEINLWSMPVARPYMPDPEKVAEIIQNDLSEVGITVNIVREEWAPYLEKTAEGEHDMFLLGLSGTNGDPDNFLNNLLHSNNIGSTNRTFYKNEKVDDLFDRARVLTDQNERAELYKEAQRLISEDSPMVTLVHSTPVLAARKEVENYKPHPATTESLAEVELSK
ncbi:ABC transporter substrate-binding protein [Virgibacillus byunsanensis]|uniref:ABC transporter substrate-binding protein n=1 Tax=Virgibacillus byunsanensis TaxID=570945 RepID=A0ABW3LJ91_9BACI